MIESKSMAMTFSKSPLNGNSDQNESSLFNSPIRSGTSTLSAGESNIRLPSLGDLNSDMDSSNIVTKILESKENPFVSRDAKTGVQGNVVTIVLSQPDGSEMSVTNSTEPISIRLTRPIDKRPAYQQQEVQGTAMQYHKVSEDHRRTQHNDAFRVGLFARS